MNSGLSRHFQTVTVNYPEIIVDVRSTSLCLSKQKNALSLLCFSHAMSPNIIIKLGSVLVDLLPHRCR